MTNSLTDALQRLKMWNSPTYKHAPVQNAAEWQEQLKHVVPAETTYALTKTLLLKPKQAKTDPLKVVMVVALESTATPMTPLAKHLKFKEMRFANDDVLQQVLQCSKSDVNPFAIEHVADKSSVDVVLDTALKSSKELLAFHPGASDQTVLVSAEQLASFLQGQGVAWADVDFKSLAATSQPTEKLEKKPEVKKPEVSKPSAQDKGETKLGIDAQKDQDFPSWYQQVLTRSEMLDYYDVSGCYILRPWSYNIWKQIQQFFEAKITDMGVEPCYFPMFVSQRALEREKDHVEGFAPEVAWVTKAGSSDLAEPIAVRPTSETVMYPAYANWLRSWRDLPLRLNQWCNVVRWEFKNPQPFLRTREFLWQEGHTAFMTKEEADKEVREILDLYAQVYQDLLAVPVIQGVKSEKEKFAGGLYTTTCEAFIPTTGRAIQGATSHCLGQNFSKMFDIAVINEQEERVLVWQNSWGLTTRTIGVMVMVHGDNQGLVLPPRVAAVQVVVIPVGVTVNSAPGLREKLDGKAHEIVEQLKTIGIRAKADVRTNYSPGWKYNHWELKGVPLRLEVGPKDVEKNEVRSVRRDNSDKQQLPLADLKNAVPALLDRMQKDMLERATRVRNERLRYVTDWKDFVPALDGKNLVMIPWCEQVMCEEEIKERSARV